MKSNFSISSNGRMNIMDSINDHRKGFSANKPLQLSTDSIMRNTFISGKTDGHEVSRMSKASLFKPSATLDASPFSGVLDFSDTIKRLNFSRKKLRRFDPNNSNAEDAASSSRSRQVEFDSILKKLNDKIECSKNSNGRSVMIFEKHDKMSRSTSVLKSGIKPERLFKYKTIEMSDCLQKLESILKGSIVDSFTKKLIVIMDETEDIYEAQFIDFIIQMMKKKKKQIERPIHFNQFDRPRAKSPPIPSINNYDAKVSFKNPTSSSQRDLQVPMADTKSAFITNRNMRNENISIQMLENTLTVHNKKVFDHRRENRKKGPENLGTGGLDNSSFNGDRKIFTAQNGEESKFKVSDLSRNLEDSVPAEEYGTKYIPNLPSRGLAKVQKIEKFFKDFENRQKTRENVEQERPSKLRQLIFNNGIRKDSIPGERDRSKKREDSLEAGASSSMYTTKINFNHVPLRSSKEPLFHSRLSSLNQDKGTSSNTTQKDPESVISSMKHRMFNVPSLESKPGLQKRSHINTNYPFTSFAKSINKISAPLGMIDKTTKVVKDLQSLSLKSNLHTTSTDFINLTHQRFDEQDRWVQNRSTSRIEEFRDRILMRKKL